MALQSKQKSKLRPHDVQVPPPTKPIPPGASHRRSVAHGAEHTAQKLVHEVGSTSAAKKVIDTVADLESAPDFRDDHLATRWGFNSRKDMLAGSKPIEDRAGASWWATKLPDGSWIVWNRDTTNSTKYSTLEKAQQGLLAQESVDELKSPAAIPDIFVG
jgi:hypothetical protein